MGRIRRAIMDANGHTPQKGTIQTPKTKRTRRLVIAGVVLVVLAAILIGLTFCSSSWYDNDASVLDFSGMTDEEIKSELNKKVQEGMMNIQIASTITFENGASEGAARIKNAEANERDQKVTITLDDTGETIYESGAIPAGSGIDRIRLTQSLPQGTYPATAIFEGYDPETHNLTGTAGVTIEIKVLN